MESDKSHPVTLYGQTGMLALQASRLRDAVQKAKPRNLPANVIPDLANLAEQLSAITRKVETLENQYGNMQALVQVGSVVNSSLELDEVLRIVMDNIVRLTHAERGFLVLRNEQGRDGRPRSPGIGNRSPSSPREAATSRTIMQTRDRIRRADHYHQCTGRSAFQSGRKASSL